MGTPEAVLLSQLPLVLMSLLYFFELRRIRAALESVERSLRLLAGK